MTTKPVISRNKPEERPRHGKPGALDHEAAGEADRELTGDCGAARKAHHRDRRSDRLEELLTSLAEDHSSLKDMALSISGSMAALGHTVAGNEILKNSFANFACENFEVAAYKSSITVAELRL